MNTCRISDRQEGHEPCKGTQRARMQRGDPDFDRALASATTGPQDPSQATALGKGASGSAAGPPNASVPIDATLIVSATGAFPMPESLMRGLHGGWTPQDRPSSDARTDSRSRSASDLGDRASGSDEPETVRQDSVESPAEFDQLWTQARLHSSGIDAMDHAGSPDAATGEQTPMPSLVASPLSQGGTARQPNGRVSAAMTQPNADSTPEKFDQSPSAAGRGASQVTVRFDGGGGLEGRLRVAVRGQSVQATIMSDSPAMTHQLGDNIDQLHHSLRERGFSESNITIQTVQEQAPRLDRVAEQSRSWREDETDRDSKTQQDPKGWDFSDPDARHPDRHQRLER